MGAGGTHQFVRIMRILRNATVGLALLAAAGLWTSLVGQETIEPVSTRKAAQPAPNPLSGILDEPRKEEPWLGVRLSKPATALYAQLPKVPKGTGFVVQDLPADCPAERAGVKQYDFLWKMDDQLLINEAQFLALLDLQKVGDTVRLTIFRGGENIELEAVLQTGQRAKKAVTRRTSACCRPRFRDCREWRWFCLIGPLNCDMVMKS